MATFYYPDDPWRGIHAGRRSVGESAHPTLEDYARLVESYRDLATRFEQQSKTLEGKNSELAIKSEALQRASADVKQLESNLQWTNTELEETRKQLAEAQAGNWQERYTQLQAEVENLRKRWEQRYAAETAEARTHILADMLPLADHLDLALQHLNGNTTQNIEAIVDNLEATRSAFLKSLQRYGVEPLSAQGQLFDPALHEAIGFLDDPQTPADHVAQVVQTGYLAGERLLRPARVMVSRGA
jgi:molecular chaperone GrpE